MTGKELKEWRKKNGLTQVELSKHLNVAWATVARWEIDVRKIPPYLHLALATIARELKTKGGEKKDAMRKKKTRKVDD
jgi:DNA-binding transcriptional regulator YiaG